ncbi:GNAT family N-acetyltransferase [Methylobacter sp.]|uniref:GNAT family N-acetyltransferase n=1 Tax=Methylobacter sp. TaxID=2051955 RepID=UPI00248895AB|nr:GNAT family N-acetyltransferase [Methylobacter sp.]MDI1277837.1 GNAT family N-acetyltransferase [Methylobacter sp.]MDI1358481.1 GNAT family N-acetyltransferase [Methylobacter sp.]
MEVKQIHSMAQVDSTVWNRLAGDAYPFLRHEFLLALEQSGSVSEQTGWEPSHLLVMDEDELVAFMPLYLKRHSWGEYVFDHQWAQAYQQQGIDYYPKWLTAIPLTPCQGERIVFAEAVNPVEVMQLLLDFIKQLSDKLGISSWHCLFPVEQQAELLRSLGLSIREGVQFHWFNRGYGDFNDFLQTLNAGKRKMLKRERRRVSEQGVSLLRIAGPDVSEVQWRAFFQFYTMTYLKRGSQPYLNPAFFQQIAATMGEQLLLVLAVKDDNYIAAALSFVGADTLYGRYWGCHEEYNSLHFEVCYYQGLDYCIEHGLKRFDSGAQGEHKIARGFEPITTYSAHWIKDARFAKAIGHFLVREQQAIRLYKQDAASYLPFKQSP